jgi:hypothetical protein
MALEIEMTIFLVSMYEEKRCEKLPEKRKLSNLQ